MANMADPISTGDTFPVLMERLLKFRAEHPCKYLQVAGVRWEYLVGGDSPNTLLFLTGGLRVAETAFAYIRLFEKTYRVIVPTYPPVWTMDEIADGIATILEAEHAPRVLVLGQSYGGLMAQGFIGRHPSRVTKLVLSSTGPLAASKLQLRLFPVLVGILACFPERLLKRLWLEALWPLLSVPESEKVFWRSYLADVFEHRITKEAVLSHFRTAADALEKYGYDGQEQARWPGPILIIGGDKDPTSTQEDRRQMAMYYPQAQVYVISEAGHTVGMQKPEEYAAVVREFFDRRA